MNPATLTKAPVLPRTAGGSGDNAPPRLPPGSKQPGPDSAPDDDWALRCPICNLDWPLLPALFGFANRGAEFLELTLATREDPDGSDLACPTCDGSVHVADNLNPLTVEEAWAKKNHADFEDFYEQRGEREPLSREELERYVNP